ncbi:hypothetical protein [Granulicella arctica]|uniref:hypothetical protein n=1 Tax=Granulicella arctica TaxID=940613 RepID=UPI0021DFEDDD|nr:hypothetical protein [Granulicella arctica]
MASVLHIGLPLAPPWLTAEESLKIAARLTDIAQRMETAGYRYAVMHASPDIGLNEFRARLREVPYDAIVIGGGVAADPQLSAFKRQVMDVVTQEAPDAKVLEFDHSIDIQILVDRALKPL